MNQLFGRAVDFANKHLSNNVHNYGAAGFLALTLLIGLSLLIRYLFAGQEPGSGSLDLFLYSGGLYCTVQGVNGGLHVTKAIKGKSGLNTPEVAAPEAER
jgi:hypothetical protein